MINTLSTSGGHDEGRTIDKAVTKGNMLTQKIRDASEKLALLSSGSSFSPPMASNSVLANISCFLTGRIVNRFGSRRMGTFGSIQAPS